MKSRWVLMLLTALLMLVGVGVWWMFATKSTSTQSIPDIASPASTPSEPVRLDVAEPTSSNTMSREKIHPGAPTPSRAPSAGVLRTQGSFSGRIKSAADGADILGAYVHLERIDAVEPMDPPIADYSDSSGEYTIHGAPEGNWTLVCSAHAYVKAEVGVFMTTSGEKKHQDFRLQPDSRLNVVVHLHGPGGRSLFDQLESGDAALVDLLRPVFVEHCPQSGADLPAGASTMAFQGRAADHVHAVTDEWQRVQLRSPRGGCCCVLLGDRVLDAVAYAPGMRDLMLVVSMEDLHAATGSVRLEIVDAATRAPISGVSVSLRPAAGPTRIASTDADGRAELTLVLPGEVVCEITAAGHAYTKKKLTLPAGTTTDLGTIQLLETHTLSGTIDLPALPSGTTRAGVLVYAYGIADKDGAEFESQVRSRADGAFEFPQLNPGEYVIGWQHPIPRPDPEAVRNRAVPGWIYVDVRYGAVNGVRIP